MGEETPFQLWWDPVVLLLLLLVVLFSPYEISFLGDRDIVWLKVVNYMVDAMFTIDMIVQFFVPYEGPEGQAERRVSKIAVNYIKGFFLVDFLSVFPLQEVVAASYADDAAASNFGAFRLIRLLRMTKMLKVVRSIRVIQHYQLRLSIPYSVMTCLYCVVGVAVMSHWGACVWHLFGNLSSESLTWVQATGMLPASAWQRYCTALYFSIATLTTIGYGDVTAQNWAEELVAVALMLFGAAAYAYIIGGIVGVFTSMNEEVTDYNRAMDNLNKYMNNMHIPNNMKIKLRSYFKKNREIHIRKYYNSTLALMSPGLRRKVSTYTLAAHAIQNLTFFSDERIKLVGEREMRNFFGAIARRLEPAAYPAHESIFNRGDPGGRMLILDHGLVSCNKSSGSVVMGSGQAIGTEFVCDGIRVYTAISMTFVSGLWLSREHLFQTLEAGGTTFELIEIAIDWSRRWVGMKIATAHLGSLVVMLRDGSENCSLTWANSACETLIVSDGFKTLRVPAEQVWLILGSSSASTLLRVVAANIRRAGHRSDSQLRTQLDAMRSAKTGSLQELQHRRSLLAALPILRVKPHWYVHGKASAKLADALTNRLEQVEKNRAAKLAALAEFGSDDRLSLLASSAHRSKLTIGGPAGALAGQQQGGSGRSSVVGELLDGGECHTKETRAPGVVQHVRVGAVSQLPQRGRTAAEAERDQLQRQYAQLKDESAAVQRRATVAETERDLMQRQYVQLKDESAAAQRRAAGAERRATAAEAERNMLRRQYAQLKDESSKLQERAAAAEAERDLLRKGVAAVV